MCGLGEQFDRLEKLVKPSGSLMHNASCKVIVIVVSVQSAWNACTGPHRRPASS